jgi:radical SAM superfamily enzyme YgiQ (UPF0313 family)
VNRLKEETAYMKVSLIEPHSPDYHVYSRVVIPRLGAPILATILRRLGHEVKVYVEDLAPIRLADALDVLKSDLVGISCTSATAPRGYAMARLLRLKGVPVVFGGVHPTFMPEEPLKYADYVLKGEAEESLPLLVKALESSGDLSCVPNLLYLREGAVVRNAERPLCMDLDDVPVPDFSLVNGYRRMKIYPVMSSRGCPHACTFCCVSPMFGRRLRVKSVPRLMEELEAVGPASVFFSDDNFTASPAHTKEVLSEMLHRCLVPPRWYAQVRADIWRDQELMDLLERTRCRRVFIGFESVDQDVLDSYGKHQRLSDMKACVSAFHRRGVGVHGMFMFGADGDDAGAFDRTVRFALEQELDTVQLLVLTPAPGTDFFRQLDAEGRIFTYDWSLYDGQHVVFEPARMTPLQLQMGAFRANRRFYSLRSVCSSLSCRRFTTAMLRYAGGRILSGWRRTNARFIQALRDFQASGRTRFRLPRPQLERVPFQGIG